MTNPIPLSCPPSSGSDPRAALRRRLWLVAVLLALTVGGAVLSRLPGARAAVPALATDLHFDAPGPGPVRFSGQLDRGSVWVGGGGLVNLELVIAGDLEPGSVPQRIASDVVVVLDRSGSMQGQPFLQARAAVRELVGRLGEQDRFALVSYASDVTTPIPLGPATPEARQAWLATLDRLQVGGGTNMAAGLDRAIANVEHGRTPGRMARVILLSDGHANEGDASFEGLRWRAARAVEGEFVMSTIGIGEGFDETLMTALSDAGTGNFYYLRSLEGLAEIFTLEFASARETVASALRVDLDLAPDVELLSAAGYPVERAGRRASFRPGALYAGQERRIWLGLRVPVREDAGEAPAGLARVALSYRDETANGVERELSFDRMPAVARVKRQEEFLASVDERSWAQSVVVDAYHALQESVAVDVQAGRRDQAIERMKRFVAAQEEINRHLQSPEVSEVMGRVAKMERDVNVALSPAAAPAARNDLGKKYTAEGHDGRRVGAKRQ